MTEASPVLPRMMSARLISDGGDRSVELRVWYHSRNHLAVLLDSDSTLDAGDEYRLELRLPDQSHEQFGSVKTCVPTLVGRIAILELNDARSNPRNEIQRRGTERYVIDCDVRPSCQIVHPMKHGKSLSADVCNISISGFLAVVGTVSPNVTTNQLVQCVMELPGKTSVHLAARVRAIHPDSEGDFSIRCEFENPTDKDIQTLIEYVAQFGTRAGTDSIIRSRLMTWDVSQLFCYEFGLSSTALAEYVEACKGPSDSSIEREECCIESVGVRIGKLPVAVFGFVAREPGSGKRDPFFLYRPELPTLPGAYHLLACMQDIAAKHNDPGILNCPDSLQFAASVVPESTFSKTSLGSVSWSNYATSYDVMCSVNPAYDDNLEIFSRWLSNCDLPKQPTIVDFGAGTGNYVVAAANKLPKSKIVHLERDPIMNRLASRKYRRLGVHNASFMNCDVETTRLSELAIDVAIMVNSLYSFNKPTAVLSNVFDLLKPGGSLFLIDLGREMNVADWARYIVQSSLKTNGLIGTIRKFYEGRHAITQNRRIREAQDKGIYWKHTATKLRADLESIGFEVAEIGTCYRGYCDSAICVKPT